MGPVDELSVHLFTICQDYIGLGPHEMGLKMKIIPRLKRSNGNIFFADCIE